MNRDERSEPTPGGAPSASKNRRVALITGGSRGIGRASALLFARRGIDVAFCFLSNRTAAAETAAAIEEHGVRALPIRANVGNEAHLDTMFRKVEETFGGLDLFVSNAATGVLKPALELTARDWARSIDVNARALLFGAQRAVPLMRGRPNPAIIAVTSMGSARVIPNYAAIGASKAAIEALVRYLAVELKPEGITVNAVSAGVVATDSLALFPNRSELLASATKRGVGGKVQTAGEVAAVIELLASPAARWITGETVIADGGYTLPV